MLSGLLSGKSSWNLWKILVQKLTNKFKKYAHKFLLQTKEVKIIPWPLKNVFNGLTVSNIRFVQMRSLTCCLFSQVSDQVRPSGPLVHSRVLKYRQGCSF